MTVSIIVAMTPDRLIGKAGQLPWHLSADLKRFKRLTMGHTIVMGRRTHESIGRLLPGRSSIILSRSADYRVPGALVVPSLEQALATATADEPLFLIGGSRVYETGLSCAQRIYRTLVHAQLEGDVYFPLIDDREWTVVESVPGHADDRNQFDYTFEVLDRR